jgi:RHS repeat-associated protein
MPTNWSRRSAAASIIERSRTDPQPGWSLIGSPTTCASPGQYALPESGLYYNYFRDYDPQTGRYIESDPIGLRAGVNTYGYVNGNPIQRVDPQGLVGWSGTASSVSWVSGLGASFTRFNLTSECKCGRQIDVTILAVGPSAGVGFKLAGTVAPFSISDPWPCPDVGSLNGLYSSGSAGISWGAWPNPNNPIIGSTAPGAGLSVGYTTMGDGIAIGWPPGIEFGRDKSITATVGSATVTSAKVKSCCGK